MKRILLVFAALAMLCVSCSDGNDNSSNVVPAGSGNTETTEQTADNDTNAENNSDNASENTDSNENNTGSNESSSASDSGNGTETQSDSESHTVSTADELLAGTWRCTANIIARYLEFYSNGTGKSYYDSPSNCSTFSWSVSGTTLTMTGNVRNSTAFTVTATTLHLTTFCGVQNLTWVRK